MKDRGGEGRGGGLLIHTYTLFGHRKNIGYKTEIKNNNLLIYMFAVREYKQDSCRFISLLIPEM